MVHFQLFFVMIGQINIMTESLILVFYMTNKKINKSDGKSENSVIWNRHVQLYIGGA
jgi:hypothetical protein